MPSMAQYVFAFVLIFAALLLLHAVFSRAMSPLSWFWDMLFHGRQLPRWKSVLAIGFGVAFFGALIYASISRAIQYLSGQ